MFRTLFYTEGRDLTLPGTCGTVVPGPEFPERSGTDISRCIPVHGVFPTRLCEFFRRIRVLVAVPACQVTAGFHDVT